MLGDQQFQFTLWRSLDSTEATLGGLRLLIILMAPAFLAVAVAGGWWLSRHELRPVGDMTEAAQRTSLQNLSTSLPVPRHGHELQRLCEAWNEMLRRLDNSARQLRQITADAAHELRTPLTLIRTTAELTLRKERTPEQYQEALRGIQKDAEKLAELVRKISAEKGTERN
jgi:signal transduction histidine kinase